ncbi:DUF3592 domain-containing protein [Thermodesulfobacteriota bacterium]
MGVRKSGIASPVIFFLVGGAMIILFGIKVMDGLQSEKWLPTKAQIICWEGGEGRGVENKRRSFININYLYSVYGQTYSGEHITYQSLKSNTQSLQSIDFINKYKKGDMVDVYYNPEDPSQAILIPGYSKLYFIILILGLILIIFGVGIYKKTGSITKGIKS